MQHLEASHFKESFKAKLWGEKTYMHAKKRKNISKHFEILELFWFMII